MQVIKRDGSETDFDRQRIKNAIFNAMKYGSGIVKEDIADKIIEKLANTNNEDVFNFYLELGMWYNDFCINYKIPKLNHPK